MTSILDKSGHPMPGHPQLPVEKAVETKILSEKDPVQIGPAITFKLVSAGSDSHENEQTKNQTNKQTNGGCQTRSDANAR